MEKSPRHSVSALSAGFQFAVCILIPLWIGFYVDRKRGTSPWGLFVGLLIGLAVGTWSVFRPLWLEAQEEEKAAKQEHKNGADKW